MKTIVATLVPRLARELAEVVTGCVIFQMRWESVYIVGLFVVTDPKGGSVVAITGTVSQLSEVSWGAELTLSLGVDSVENNRGRLLAPLGSELCGLRLGSDPLEGVS